RWTVTDILCVRFLRCRSFVPSLFLSLAHSCVFLALCAWNYDHPLSDGLFIWGRDLAGIRTCSSHDAGAPFTSATASGTARSSCATDLAIRVEANERSGTNADKNDP